MMTRRSGMTLVEVLASLALLAMLATAVSGWCTWATRAEAEYGPRLHAEAAVRAVLRLIQQDLLGGDFTTRRGAQKPNQDERVTIDSGELRTHTRDRGPVIHRYRLDPASHALTRESTKHDGLTTSRLLMKPVELFECAIDTENRELTVTIQTPGRSLTQSYRIE